MQIIGNLPGDRTLHEEKLVIWKEITGSSNNNRSETQGGNRKVSLKKHIANTRPQEYEQAVRQGVGKVAGAIPPPRPALNVYQVEV